MVRQVEEHIADAVSKGASVLLGGGAHGAGPLFFEPTVLSGCHAEMLCTHEETFGPVAPLYRFETEDEVVSLRKNPLHRRSMLQHSTPRAISAHCGAAGIDLCC